MGTQAELDLLSLVRAPTMGRLNNLVTDFTDKIAGLRQVGL